MIIDIKLAEQGSPIEPAEQIFIIASLLHINGKINDKKLAAIYKGLTDKTLIRRVNTYHCKINDRWYNDESMLEIYYDLKSELKVRAMDWDTFFKYAKRYTNRNTNYTIDYIFNQFVKPLVDSFESYNSDYYFKYLKTLDGDRLIDVDISYDRFEPRGSYCCEDCDGDYEEYKTYQYENYIRYTVCKNIKENLENFLQSKREIKNPAQIKTLF